MSSIFSSRVYDNTVFIPKQMRITNTKGIRIDCNDVLGLLFNGFIAIP